MFLKKLFGAPNGVWNVETRTRPDRSRPMRAERCIATLHVFGFQAKRYFRTNSELYILKLSPDGGRFGEKKNVWETEIRLEDERKRAKETRFEFKRNTGRNREVIKRILGIGENRRYEIPWPAEMPDESCRAESARLVDRCTTIAQDTVFELMLFQVVLVRIYLRIR